MCSEICADVSPRVRGPGVAPDRSEPAGDLGSCGGSCLARGAAAVGAVGMWAGDVGVKLLCDVTTGGSVFEVRVVVCFLFCFCKVVCFMHGTV